MNEAQTKEVYFCPACGAAADREQGESCAVCGKLLREGYFPLDNLRASYRGKSWQNEDKQASLVLFEENKNKASETARAFAIYSMVPYLGILFCPGAMLMGSVGIFAARRNPKLGGERMSRFSVIAGILILLLQLFLWWLLYYIPTLGRQV